ncbi:MAG: biopolymer transporter ExbD [Planctomycetota bacterium]
MRRVRPVAEDGTIGGRRRLGADSAELDLTPMIDVTFLLLIFFMVTSTMRTPDPTDVPPAATATTAETGSAFLIRLERLGGEPRLTFEAAGEEVSVAATDALDGGTLEAALRDAVDATDGGGREVLVNAAGDTPHGVVSRVARVVESVEGTRLFFGVREKADSAPGPTP